MAGVSCRPWAVLYVLFGAEFRADHLAPREDVHQCVARGAGPGIGRGVQVLRVADVELRQVRIEHGVGEAQQRRLKLETVLAAEDLESALRIVEDVGRVPALEDVLDADLLALVEVDAELGELLFRDLDRPVVPERIDASPHAARRRREHGRPALRGRGVAERQALERAL